MAQQNNNPDQEINLAEISKKIKGSISRSGIAFYNMLLFIKRNIIIILTLFILGGGLGYYLDKKTKVYDHQVIVIPNFGSVNYLYSKVNLLSAKLKEKDTLYLKNIGVLKPKTLLKIEIEPINNVYDFVSQRVTNFDLLKLMAEDGNINKVIDDPTTSKNYTYHRLLLSTKDKSELNALVGPLLKYFNDSEYYERIKQQESINVDVKLKQNDSIIKQIDGILNSFSSRTGAERSSSLVYNENTELSDIIKSKDELITENARLHVVKINQETIIKDTSVTLNVLNKEGVNGKAKYILPLGLILFYIIGAWFINFVKTQAQLRKLD